MVASLCHHSPPYANPENPKPHTAMPALCLQEAACDFSAILTLHPHPEPVEG
jgi:hypothetical protein